MRVYVSGPIAGQPNGNREAFERASTWLRGQGHEPVNPHEVDHAHDGECSGRPTDREGDTHRYGCYLLADLIALTRCEAIATLRGWRQSPGATVEVAFASALGIKNLGGVP